MRYENERGEFVHLSCYVTDGGQEHYAVKTIVTSTVMEGGGLSVDLDEQLLSRLPSLHWPNFIKVHDVWTEKGPLTEKICIRMDVALTTLRGLLRLGWKYNSAPPWLDIMRGIANGLSQAHQFSIVHGDLKPSNGLSA